MRGQTDLKSMKKGVKMLKIGLQIHFGEKLDQR